MLRLRHCQGHNWREAAVGENRLVLREVGLTLSCAAGLFSLCPLVMAADGVPWLTDRAVAAKQAAQQRKLLLVVDLAEDFLVDPEANRRTSAFRSLALSDTRVRELLSSRFVVTIRHVGQSARVQRTIQFKGGPQPPTSDFALALVCLSSERVLHCIPGLLSPQELFRELQWAESCNEDRLRATPSAGRSIVRERHLTLVPAAQRKAFDKLYASKWTDEFELPLKQPSEGFTAAIRTAQAVRDRILLDRLKANWPTDENKQTILAALAEHAGLEPTLPHLILAEFPLVRLADVERPLFEIASRQRFWQRAASRETLANWWRDVRRTAAPSLLVVSDDPFYAIESKDIEPLAWPSRDAQLAASLRSFAVKAVTLDELAMLAADAGLDPIHFTAVDGPPRYLVYDARGFRIAQLHAREGTIKRLSEVLHATLSPGEPAVAASAEGETKDERD